MKNTKVSEFYQGLVFYVKWAEINILGVKLNVLKILCKINNISILQDNVADKKNIKNFIFDIDLRESLFV